MREKLKTVNFPVFGYRIRLCYTTDLEKSRIKRNKDFGVCKWDLSDGVEGLHSYSDKEKPLAMIFFTPFSSTGTIAHECFHAIFRMFKYYDVQIENENFAYHLGFLLDETLKLKE